MWYVILILWNITQIEHVLYKCHFSMFLLHYTILSSFECSTAIYFVNLSRWSSHLEGPFKLKLGLEFTESSVGISSLDSSISWCLLFLNESIVIDLDDSICWSMGRVAKYLYVYDGDFGTYTFFMIFYKRDILKYYSFMWKVCNEGRQRACIRPPRGHARLI